MTSASYPDPAAASARSARAHCPAAASISRVRAARARDCAEVRGRVEHGFVGFGQLLLERGDVLLVLLGIAEQK